MKNIFFLLALFLATGCTHPALKIETQTIPVFSQPSGASVTVDGKEAGTTPISLVLEKNTDHMVMITKEGFDSTALPIERKLNHEALAINSLLKASPIFVFHPFEDSLEEIEENETTGKAYRLEPKVIQVTLSPIKIPEPKKEP